MNDMNNKFKFDLPGEWEDQTVFYFRGPSIDGTDHQISLALDRNLQHENIVEFAKQQTDPLTENLQGLEVLKDEETTIEDGNPVYEFTCRWTPGEGLSIIKKYIFVFHDNMGFTFNCDFNKKSYKMLNSQFKLIVESLLPGTYEPLDD